MELENNPQVEQVQQERIQFTVDRTKFSNVVDAIATLVDEATFEVTTDGLTFRGMDRSHVAMLDIVMGNANFAFFHKDNWGKFGVRIDELQKILKQFKPVEKSDGEYIDVEIKDNKLVIQKDTSDGTIQTSLRTIEPSSGSTPLPRITFNSELVVPTAKLLRQIESLNVVSEYVTLKSQEGNTRDVLSLKGKGDSAEQENKIIAEVAGVKADSEATYSIDYLKSILRVFKNVNTSVQVNFSSKMPLRIDAKIGFGANIHFYVAPRIVD